MTEVAGTGSGGGLIQRHVVAVHVFGAVAVIAAATCAFLPGRDLARGAAGAAR